MALRFYNTLSREKETFVPIEQEQVRMYTCGPTVYDYVHIGNLRAYLLSDLLFRTLTYFGYRVRRVMNLTDIGHLSGDADSGEDKMTKGLLREGLALNLPNMRALAEKYAEKFKMDMRAMNMEVPRELYFATDYVKEDIELLQKLEEKGYTYKTSDGIYFDTAKMPDYGILVGGKKNWDKKGARIAENKEKKQPEDFALWKLNPELGWESPWGRGFPGWHIECSAMGMKFLGEQFDIHTGGIDLIPTHHTNEIAQSECATGRSPFVRFWIHNEHVDIGGEKMAKSEGNFLRLIDITEHGLSPLSYRLWLLMGHYRTKLNFNWEALSGAEAALKRLYGAYLETGKEKGVIDERYREKFKERIEDDLDTPGALAALWDLVKNGTIHPADKKATMLDLDQVLGLGFANLKEEKIPEEIMKLVEWREQARKRGDFPKSDELRKKINYLGYEVKDTPNGPKILQNVNLAG